MSKPKPKVRLVVPVMRKRVGSQFEMLAYLAKKGVKEAEMATDSETWQGVKETVLLCQEAVDEARVMIEEVVAQLPSLFPEPPE